MCTVHGSLFNDSMCFCAYNVASKIRVHKGYKGLMTTQSLNFLAAPDYNNMTSLFVCLLVFAW